MLFDVYNLGSDASALRALGEGPVRGELIVRRRFPDSPHDDGLMAMVCEPGTSNTLLHPLHYARFVAMNGHSMVIEGTMVTSKSQSPKAKVTHHKVRWLCKLPGAPAVLDTGKLKAHRARLDKAIADDPFHPARDAAHYLQNDYGPLDDSIN